MGNNASRRDYDGKTCQRSKTDICWMDGVSDNTPLSALSIPGTHQSVSFRWGPACVCQTWPLSDQLVKGVRFIDVRVRHVKNNLLVYHGKFGQGITFADVLRECLKFLGSHPSETILMRVKKEGTGQGNSQTLSQTLSKLMVPKQCFYLTRSDSLPEMGQARGKVVLLKNFPGDKIGFPYSTADIHDDWNIPNIFQSSLDRKWHGIEKHLNSAKQAPESDLYITYTSGASALAFPNAVARRINPRLHRYVRVDKGRRARYGVVAMDFTEAELVKLIVDSNFYL